MEINYELTPEDFYAFSKENAPNQKSHQPMVIIYLITYSLFIFADIIYAVFFGSLSDWDFGAFLLSLGLRTVLTFAAVLILLALIKVISFKKINDVLKETGKENGVFGEHRIILTESELIEVTDVNTSHYSWKSVGEIKEFENYVAIGILLANNYIIPKRCFQDQKQIKKFIETANFHQQNAEHAFQLSHFTKYEKSLE